MGLVHQSLGGCALHARNADSQLHFNTKTGWDLADVDLGDAHVAALLADDEDEAVRRANDTPHGLVAYFYTQSLARGQRMIERLESGMVGLNVGVVSNAAAPFGGWKHSGLGREGGAEGIDEYLQTKYTLTADPFA